MRSIARLGIPIRLISLAALVAVISGCKGPEDASKGGTPSSGSPISSAGGAEASAAFDAPRKADGEITIKIVTNGVSPFWDPMVQGMEAMSKELGCAATWQAPQPTDNNTQKRVFQDAMAAGADGIAVSPIQADAFAAVIDEAIGKGVPVITFDSDSANSKRLAYIGTNNYEAGKRAGEEAVKLLPNGGKFVAFVGNMSAQNARDRYQGFLDGVKGHNIEPLQPPFEDDKDVARARRNVQDAISRYGAELSMMVGLYSYNPPAIVDEVKAKNLRGKIKIVGFDGEPKTQKALEDGMIDATIVQKPYDFGKLATKLLYLINRKGLKAAMEEMKPALESDGMKIDGNNIDTGVKVITPANAAEFLKWLRDNGLKST